MDTVAATFGATLESTIMPEVTYLGTDEGSSSGGGTGWIVSYSNVHADRVWLFWDTGKIPTTRQLMKEDKPTRKLLRDWKRLSSTSGVLYRTVFAHGKHVNRFCCRATGDEIM